MVHEFKNKSIASRTYRVGDLHCRKGNITYFTKILKEYQLGSNFILKRSQKALLGPKHRLLQHLQGPQHHQDHQGGHRPLRGHCYKKKVTVAWKPPTRNPLWSSSGFIVHSRTKMNKITILDITSRKICYFIIFCPRMLYKAARRPQSCRAAFFGQGTVESTLSILTTTTTWQWCYM